MAPQAETQSRLLMFRFDQAQDVPSRHRRGNQVVQPLLGVASSDSGRRLAAPRSARLTLGSLAADQQLAQHVKIPAQHP